jgi:DNA-binding Lrp family transcriptional regulator
MQKVKLDTTDRKILAELQANGRITNVKLADLVDISAPPCLRRVRALEEAGLIKGYHADLDSKGLGYEVTVFAQVSLAHHSDAQLKAFEAQVSDWEEVRECHLMQGDYDFLLKCVVRDLPAYQDLLTQRLMAAPNVDRVKSLNVVRTAKKLPGVPMDRK